MWFLGSALYKGLDAGRSGFSVPPPPPLVAAFILLGFFLFASIVPFLARRRRNFWGARKGTPGLVGQWIDRMWGAGTCAAFEQRLRPVALFTSTAVTFGITGLASAYANEQSWPTYFNCGFFLSCGLGLAVTYILSLRFPPRLY
jgi:hypothetical protein